MNRQLRTIALGAVPLVLLSCLVTFDRIPGTDISLTVPYAAEGPGPTFNTLGEYDGEPVVDIQGADLDETSGNLNMTTVSVRSNMTLLQAMTRWLLYGDTLVPIEQIFPQDQTEEEVNQANEEAFSVSEASATIAAMNYLELPVSTRVAQTTDASPAKDVLQEGDIILSVDGEDKTSPSQVRDAVQAKKPGDELTIGYEREGIKQEATVTLAAHPHDESVAFLGVSMEAIPAGGISVNYNLEDVGGPSAGMMFSLAVIDKLSPGELTGGKFVAGTGTIDDEGTVGPIGGITHKIQAAKDAGAEVFLAPADNCAEAASEDDGITVLKVTSIDDAISQLEAYSAGKDVVTCD